MGTKYRCTHCNSEVVLVTSGGVARTIICSQCNDEMGIVGNAETVEKFAENGGFIGWKLPEKEL